MLLTFISTVNRAIKKYWQFRSTVYELNQLSRRDLADLGISRCDITFVAKRCVDQKYGS